MPLMHDDMDIGERANLYLLIACLAYINKKPTDYQTLEIMFELAR
jgi:hypothetical protein